MSVAFVQSASLDSDDGELESLVIPSEGAWLETDIPPEASKPALATAVLDT